MDVLISHVPEDNKRASEIATYLESKVWKVWWNGNLPINMPLDIATERVLESTHLVITLWSVHSIESRLVRNTALEAVEICQWLPIRLDDVKLPLRLRGYTTHDLLTRPLSLALEQSDSLIEFCLELESSVRSASSGSSLFDEAHAKLGSKQAVHQGELVTDTPWMAQPEFRDNDRDAVSYSRFYLGDWLVDEGHNRISRNGLVKRITPRSMQVLIFLVESETQPVSIAQLLGHIWQDRVVVESVVHRCISELREAFEDDFRTPKFIETIAKKGYQIVAAVSSGNLNRE